jgi:hypothetical protein
MLFLCGELESLLRPRHCSESAPASTNFSTTAKRRIFFTPISQFSLGVGVHARRFGFQRRRKSLKYVSLQRVALNNDAV